MKKRGCDDCSSLQTFPPSLVCAVGMLAGEALFDNLSKGEDASDEVASYEPSVRSSWINDELHKVGVYVFLLAVRFTVWWAHDH